MELSFESFVSMLPRVLVFRRAPVEDSLALIDADDLVIGVNQIDID